MTKVRQGGFLIAKVQLLSERIFAKILAKYDLTEISPAQGRILFVLWQRDGISIQELARKTSLGKSTLTSMLDRLADAGYLTREISGEDRRKIIIRLIKKDRNMRAVYQSVSDKMMGLFYQGFSSGEISQFENHLSRVLANLDEFESTE